MRLAMLVGMSALFLAGPARAQDAKASATDPAGLIGKYDIISGEDDGKPAPAERIKDHTVTITADTIVVKDKDNNERYATTYKVNTAKKPYRIDMTETTGPRGRKGAKAVGLIENDGDTVKLVYCYEGGILPAEFKTKAGDKQLMFTMKRQAAK